MAKDIEAVESDIQKLLDYMRLIGYAVASPTSTPRRRGHPNTEVAS
jgi:hypothetical protein